MSRSRFAGLRRHRVGPGAIVLEAGSFRSRLLGLAFLRGDRFPRENALLLRPCGSIHTFGMRFSIDDAFADGRGHVLRVIPNLPPIRIRSDPGEAVDVDAHSGELALVLCRPVTPAAPPSPRAPHEPA